MAIRNKFKGYYNERYLIKWIKPIEKAGVLIQGYYEPQPQYFRCKYSDGRGVTKEDSEWLSGFLMNETNEAIETLYELDYNVNDLILTDLETNKEIDENGLYYANYARVNKVMEKIDKTESRANLNRTFTQDKIKVLAIG